MLQHYRELYKYLPVIIVDCEVSKSLCNCFQASPVITHFSELQIVNSMKMRVIKYLKILQSRTFVVIWSMLMRPDLNIH